MDRIHESCKVCSVSRLSHQEEVISMVQHLPTKIVANHDSSEVVSRAISQHKEQVDRLIEIIENEFKSINGDIQRQIFNTSQELIKILNAIDNSVSGCPEDRISDDFMKFDFLQKCFGHMNDMIEERNRNINDFMDTIRGLENKRTSMIEKCYKQHMSVIRRLSSDAFERLYKKYLKFYNTIKLSNFRTYEDVRFKLVQINESLQREFLLKAHDVKIKIKKNIGKSFLDKLRTSTEKTMWDKINYSQDESVNFLNSLSDFFNKIIQKPDVKFNIAFVIECSKLLKSHLKNLEKIIVSTSTLYDEVINDVQMILTKTIEELNQIVMDSGESLSPNESVVIFEEMTTVANTAQQEKIKTIMDVQLFLRDVKEAIKIIYMVFNPALEIFYGHLKRSKIARRAVLVALDEQLKRNDLKLNILENNFNATLNTLVQASSETEVWKYEKKCVAILQNIKDRIQVSHDSETEVLSNFKDLMTTELGVTTAEVQAVISLYPDNLKPFSKLSSTTRNELWTKSSVENSILSFETKMKNCQNSIYKRLITLISELKSKDVLNDKCAWTTLFNHAIDGRFDVATQDLESKKIILRDWAVSKRLGEIVEHRNVLEQHTKVVQEISVSLKNKTNDLHERFYEERKKLMNDNNLQFEINELSSAELIDLIDKHKNLIHLAASEFNDKLKLHNINIDAEYQNIIQLNLKYMNSIKMFPEGGNYGHKETVDIANALNHLNNKMSKEKLELFKLLRPIGYESLIEIKESLIKPIKLLEIELDRKVFTRRYHAINTLVDVSVNQEILKLDQMEDSLHAKLNVVEKTFKKSDVRESSKCWSEMLAETKVYIDFLLESYRDIKALLMSEIGNSIWNTKFEKAFISSKITANSKHAFYKDNMKFYDYCKTIFINSETTGGNRFLNNIYQTIFHFVSESQSNAADLASIEWTNTWIGNDQLDMMEIYHKIMGDVVKKSKSIVLQAELIWVEKISDFIDFLPSLHAIESEFKNIVLATYHEESVMKLNESFGASERKTTLLRKRSKDVREKLHCKLKPSHGHAQNAGALDALMDEFRTVRRECSESLADTCNQIGSELEKITENYETQRPINVLKAATLSIDCHSSLLTQLDHINTKSFEIDLSSGDFSGQKSEVITESSEWRISPSTNSVKVAVQNIKQWTPPGTVFWPNNKRLWADNVRIFKKLYRDRMNEIKMYNAVEKLKLLDWASAFIRDVKKVKSLNQ